MHRLTFYYLRTPLTSLSFLLDGLKKDAFSAFIQQRIVGEAIYLASPTLYGQIQADPQLTNPKLRQTVLKYMLRMGSRSTPFGLFAGCSLGNIGMQTSLDVSDRQPSIHYRLSTPVLWELLQYLNQLPDLRQALSYHVNTSLSLLGKEYRYLEVDPLSSPPRFFTSQLKGNSALRFVLRLARQPSPFHTLVQKLNRQGYGERESEAFINQLIVDQVLISELTINVTGQDPLSQLIKLLQHIPAGESLWPGLKQVHLLLADSTPVQTKHSAVRNLFQQHFGLELSDIPLLQGDTLFNGQAHQLSTTLINGLSESLQNLFGLSRAQLPPDTLQSFKRDFYARYEEQEISLTQALDAESGIGYGSQPLAGDTPIMEILTAGSWVATESQKIDRLTPAWNDWVLKRYEHWQENNNPVLTLTDDDLATWSSQKYTLPESYYVFGYFLAASSQALDAGDYRFRSKLVAGPSAFPLVGRFCRIDESLTQQVRRAYQELQRQNPDRIYAEIVHLPTASMGNVVQRPHLSEYEIPYLGYSTLPLEKQIPITDLWISVPRGERIVLRSRRLGKEIVPRLTTAHNYTSGLPMYRFLCELQQQDSPLAVQWQWGNLNSLRYLPRVQYRQVILQEARWRLDWTDYSTSKTEAENVSRWRQMWQWPRFVALAQGDQELLLDLDIPDCQQLLVSTLRRLSLLDVFEWLRTPAQCCVQGPDGPLTHEVILPFVQRKPSLPSTALKVSNHTVKRTFIPGSEWLFLKVYGGPQICRQLLIKLGNLARSSIRAGKISHWFFIRYQDPEPHLRFRFHLTETAHYASLLSSCQQQLQPWIDTGELHRVQVDTYQRELERYGAERIENTEWIFWTDSDAVLTIRKYEYDEKNLLIAALLGTEHYLTDYGLNPADKALFCQHSFQALFEQEGAKSTLKKQLAKLYRQHQSLLVNFLSTKEESPTIAYKSYHLLLKKRSRQAKPFRLSTFSTNDQSQSYIASLIHLFLNRLFDHNQRSYKLLVYHHLARYYQAQLAKSQKATSVDFLK